MIWTLSIDKQAWESGGYRVRRHPRSTNWVASYQPWIHLAHIDGFCRKPIPGPHLTAQAAKIACEKHREEFLRSQQQEHIT